MKSKYKNYFKNHYKVDISDNDVQNYSNWFFSQFNLIKDSLLLKQKASVLEIGSGYGGFLNIAREFGYKWNYSGLELDSYAVKFTKKKFKSDKFSNTTFEKYNTKEKYDYIFAFEVLEHVDDPYFVINKINKLLKNNGVFVGTSPYPFKKNVYADETHKYVLHPSNWKKIFNDNGFKKIKTYPMTFLPFIWRISKKLNIRFPFYFSFKNIISTTLIIAYK